MTYDDYRLLQFLEQHHVVSGLWWCERCYALCRRDVDRREFRCDRRHTSVDGRRRRKTWRCSYRKSMLAGTWFSGARLPIGQICRLNCMWLTIHYPRQQFIMREVGVSAQTVVDWSSFCREVCVYWLERRSQVLGGPGVVVEIDEAKIGRRKYNRGRWVNGNWIFGGIERGTGRCFIVPVQNRGSDTLLGVIQNWIRPGTTIMSDCWKAYDCLSDEGFVHQTVNHSQNFVDPRSAAHTQHIERVWREVRGNIPRFGRKDSHMVGYLAEFLFKQKYPDHRDRVHAFFSAVAELYPPAYQ